MLRPLAAMAFLTLAWGANWAVMKIGVSEMPPLWFRGISLVLGTLLLGIVLAMRGAAFRVPPGGFATIVRLALPNIIVWYAVVTVAISLLPAGRAAILGYTMPAWAAFIAVAVHRERPDARTLVGVGCAVAAVALLVAGDWTALAGHPAGIVLMLVAAFSWAWGTHAFRRADIAMDTLVLTFWMMVVACPVVIGASALLEGDGWRWPAGAEWWPIAYNAVLVLAIGNLIWFTVARTLPPTIAGLSSMLVPVVGVFSGIAMLGELPSWRDWSALTLVCIAVVAGLLRRSARAA